MARPKIERKKETVSGVFYGQTLPEFNNITVDVETSIYSVKKGDVVTEHSENFKIKINVEKIIQSQVVELNEKLNQLCQRTLYLNSKTYFSYFTYDMEEEDKKTMFKEFLTLLTDFDKKYDPDVLINKNEQKKIFDYFQQQEDNIIQNDMVAIKHIPEKNIFCLIAKERIGRDEFIRYVKPSKVSDKVVFTEAKDYLDKKWQKKTCFVYAENDYEFVQNEVNHIIKTKQISLEKNTSNINENKENYETLNYSKENILNFFIEFSEEEQGFYFYAKGYKDPTYIRDFYAKNDAVKNLGRLTTTIKEFINLHNLAEIEEERKKYPFKVRESENFSMPIWSEIIPEVPMLKDKKQRMKWFVPLEGYTELKLIRENFMRYENILSRPKIKISFPNNSSDAYMFGIFADEKGECFLCFPKEKDTTRIDAINISYQEAKNLYENFVDLTETFLGLQKGFEQNCLVFEKSINPEISDNNVLSENMWRRAKLNAEMSLVQTKTTKRRKI